MDTSTAKQKLAINKTELFSAGLPGYGRNFTRDSLIYGLLASDQIALLAQLDYSAANQGKKANPDSGEEFGKIHHELPTGEWRGRPTAYNACDTSALFLISIAVLVNEGHSNLLERYKNSIDAAILYIKGHIKDGLFMEDPKNCGAESYALRVTYWKDSVLVGGRQEPHYPIVFSLVHFQNACALQLIGSALANPELISIGDRMKQVGVEKLWRSDHFVTSIDTEEIDNVSSDSLQSLLFIKPSELPAGYAQSISDYSKQLETKAGFLSGIAEHISDDYHTRYIWVFEQALLHAAAKKHSLESAVATSSKVVEHIKDGFPELLDAKNQFEASGNDPQLWTVGAKIYFENTQKSLIAKL